MLIINNLPEDSPASYGDFNIEKGILLHKYSEIGPLSLCRRIRAGISSSINAV